MDNFKNIAGMRFGHLIAIEPAESNRGGQKTWRCQCDCGNVCIVIGSKLRLGKQFSCGCFQGATHGYARKKRHPLYSAWKRMRQRCNDRNCTDFKYYGARGIAVCDRWNDFAVFLTDVGERPPGLTIDRINNDGNYEPKNVQWATRAEQSRNRRAYQMGAI